MFTELDARDELIELTDAVEDLRIALREIEESRAGFRIEEVETDDEIVLAA